MEKEKCDRVHARLFKITPFMECFYKKRVKNPLLYFAIAKYLLKIMTIGHSFIINPRKSSPLPAGYRGAYRS